MNKGLLVIFTAMLMSACSTLGGNKAPPPCAGCERSPINVENSV